MVYQRKQRAYEQEPQRPVPPVQTSLFNSPDLETDETDNAFSVDSSQPGPSMEVRLKQISKPLYTLDNLVGSGPVYPPSSAVQRRPESPLMQATQTDNYWQRVIARQDTPGLIPQSGKPAVQRDVMADEAAAQKAPEGGAGGAGAVELTPKGSGRPLPKQVADNFVQSGYPEVQQARVHVDDAATQSIQAHGYTMKNDIVVQSSGANNPQLLAHEATHVVQQSQMALKPDVNGTPINADRALEKNADDNGERVVRNEPVKVQGASTSDQTMDTSESSHVTPQKRSASVQCQGSGVAQRKIYSDQAMKKEMLPKNALKHLLDLGIPSENANSVVDDYSDSKNISLGALIKEAKENVNQQSSPEKEKAQEYRDLYESNNTYFEIQNYEIPAYFKAIFRLDPKPAYHNMTVEKLMGMSKMVKDTAVIPHCWASGYDEHSGFDTANDAPGKLIPVIWPGDVDLARKKKVYRGDKRAPWDDSIASNNGIVSWSVSDGATKYSNNLLRHTQLQNSPTDSTYISTSTEEDVTVNFSEGNGYIYSFQNLSGIHVNSYIKSDFSYEKELSIIERIPYSRFYSVQSMGTKRIIGGAPLRRILAEEAWDSPMLEIKPDWPVAQNNPNCTWKEYLNGRLLAEEIAAAAAAEDRRRAEILERVLEANPNSRAKLEAHSEEEIKIMLDTHFNNPDMKPLDKAKILAGETSIKQGTSKKIFKEIAKLLAQENV